MMKKTLLIIGMWLMGASQASDFVIDRTDTTRTSQLPLFYLSHTPVSFREAKQQNASDLYIDSALLTHMLADVKYDETSNNLLLDGDDSTFITKPRQFSIPLPEGGLANIVFSRIKRYGEDSYTLFGNDPTENTTQIVLSRAENYFSGTLFTKQEVYRLTSTGEDSVTIQPEKQFREPLRINAYRMTKARLRKTEQKRARTKMTPPQVKGRLKAIDYASGNVRPAIIDLMILYTPEASRQAGGESAIQARAQSNVDTMNLVLKNSGVRAEARLVNTQMIDLSESGGHDDTLEHFSESATVNALRNQYGADLVQLFVSDDHESENCGLGYILDKDALGYPLEEVASLGFQITSIKCGDYTSVHEFGHNMGLNHNIESTKRKRSEMMYPYAFGYFQDSRFRTIMAYDVCDNFCPRIPYFSSPFLKYRNMPIGEKDKANNAAVLDASVTIVSQYRNGQPQPLSNLTGVWFDPHYDGSGFNFITTGGATSLTYYGFTRTGERLWLLSDEQLHAIAGVPQSIPLYETQYGTFNHPSSYSTQWGRLDITFANCSLAFAKLTGKDGVVETVLQPISFSKDNHCH